MLEEKTNPHLVDTVLALREAARENEAPVWRTVAEQLEKPNRVHPDVNVGEIHRVAEDDAELIVVPGKVLGGGYFDREVTVAGWKFTGSTEDKIEDAGGRAIRLDEAIDEFAAGENAQVVG
jgi:large subunit ribosomal protein L18e